MAQIKDTLLPEVDHGFQYDLVVIGGGSGGLATSKAAAKHGAKVAVLDFVKPSPHGTTWGLGGTCVNVGCIPKKLMHTASIIGERMQDATSFGWQEPEQIPMDWSTLVTNVQMHIRASNFGYRNDLRANNVTYINAHGTFVDPHTIEATDKTGKKTLLTARRFLIAVGGRPNYPNIPGAELGISSDDIFSLKRNPGKTLVVGASYVALECAGFLHGVGYETTVMVRSIPLRGFDQECANKIVEHMEEHGIRFVRESVPTSVEKTEDGRLKVKYSKAGATEAHEEIYDTVLWAVGRSADTKQMHLDKAGVVVDTASGKIPVNKYEQSNIPHIYAIGDVIKGGLELTPVAIMAGRYLADRLYAGSRHAMNYINVPTTVFTPLEYGCVGLSEEDAIAKYGEDNIEVYVSSFTPLEWSLPHRDSNRAFIKMITLLNDNERVIGFHILCPNAGEVTQGVGVAFRLGATKGDFDNTVGIHPTIGEEMTSLKVTKRSGADTAKGNC